MQIGNQLDCQDRLCFLLIKYGTKNQVQWLHLWGKVYAHMRNFGLIMAQNVKQRHK